MLRLRLRMLLLLASAAMPACATGYHAVGFAGGYSETQLDKNVWTITFNGNGYTSRERSTDFALLRSAELTLLTGNRYFIIAEKTRDTSYSTYTTPTQTQTTSSATVVGNTAYGTSRTTTFGGDTYVFQKPSNSMSIVCLPNRPDSFNGIVYDAQILSQSLREKYQLP